MRYNKDHWLNIVANFRKGELLREAACAHDQFLRAPVLISPLAKEGYKKLKTSELPHYSQGGEAAADILWDGVMIDEDTHKIVLLSAYCEPEDIVKSAPAISESKREELKLKIKEWYGTESSDSWLDQYYGIGEKLIALKVLNQGRTGCFEDGWRCEVFVFNFTDEEGVMAATEKTWEDYYERAWDALFPQGDEITDLFFNTVFSL